MWETIFTNKGLGLACAGVIALESILTPLIVKYVPCQQTVSEQITIDEGIDTEIDWKAYMQQVKMFREGGITHYDQIEGDTGPLVLVLQSLVKKLTEIFQISSSSCILLYSIIPPNKRWYGYRTSTIHIHWYLSSDANLDFGYLLQDRSCKNYQYTYLNLTFNRYLHTYYLYWHYLNAYIVSTYSDYSMTGLECVYSTLLCQLLFIEDIFYPLYFSVWQLESK